MDIAAFRARSFGRRLGGVVDVVGTAVEGGCVLAVVGVFCKGFDFCASPSGMLTLGASVLFCCADSSPSGRTPPDIDVSGTPVFRGGGTCEWRSCGLYAVAVPRARRIGGREATCEGNRKMHCEHVLLERDPDRDKLQRLERTEVPARWVLMVRNDRPVTS